MGSTSLAVAKRQYTVDSVGGQAGLHRWNGAQAAAAIEYRRLLRLAGLMPGQAQETTRVHMDPWSRKAAQHETLLAKETLARALLPQDAKGLALLRLVVAEGYTMKLAVSMVYPGVGRDKARREAARILRDTLSSLSRIWALRWASD